MRSKHFPQYPRNEAFAEAAIDDFTKDHYPTGGMPAFDIVQFTAALQDPTNLDQVRLRIDHVLNRDQIAGCFYTNPHCTE